MININHATTSKSTQTMIPNTGRTPRGRVTASVCILAALLIVPSSLFAGDLGPVVHFWAIGTNNWGFGAVVFSQDTHLVFGPFCQHFAVSAATVEWFAFVAGLISALLVALSAIYFHRRNPKHHSTGIA